MFGNHENKLCLDQIPPVFPLSAPANHQHDSSSGCSSYSDSPSSNSTTYGAQSPTPMQRSISCHSIMSRYSEVYSSPPPYNIDHYGAEAFNTCHSQQQGIPHYNWSNESIYESMNRATPYTAEEKKERIEKYRSKRNLRNFNKKIKYECRKTLADSRPRVRGRFARNDEIEKAPEQEWDCAFADEDSSWITILDALNKSDAALISSF